MPPSAGPPSTEPWFRMATPDDAQAIAALHAGSWQRHYRGVYSDAFLDDEVPGYLLRLWSRRLTSPDPRARTILAERDGAVVGFAHTVLGENATWGALLDNLHVVYGLKRQGVGTRLLAMTARTVLDEEPSSGLYLWVLERNTGARAFYEARGGARVERVEILPPGGDAARLIGKPAALRLSWPNPAKLLASRP